MSEFICDSCGELLILPEDGSNTLTCRYCNTEHTIELPLEENQVEAGQQRNEPYLSEDDPSPSVKQDDLYVDRQRYPRNTFARLHWILAAFLIPMGILVIVVLMIEPPNGSSGSSISSRRSKDPYEYPSTQSIPPPPTRDLSGNRVKNGMFQSMDNWNKFGREPMEKGIDKNANVFKARKKNMAVLHVSLFGGIESHRVGIRQSLNVPIDREAPVFSVDAYLEEHTSRPGSSLRRTGPLYVSLTLRNKEGVTKTITRSIVYGKTEGWKHKVIELDRWFERSDVHPEKLTELEVYGEAESLTAAITNVYLGPAKKNR